MGVRRTLFILYRILPVFGFLAASMWPMVFLFPEILDHVGTLFLVLLCILLPISLYIVFLYFFKQIIALAIPFPRKVAPLLKLCNTFGRLGFQFEYNNRKMMVFKPVTFPGTLSGNMSVIFGSNLAVLYGPLIYVMILKRRMNVT